MKKIQLSIFLILMSLLFSTPQSSVSQSIPSLPLLIDLEDYIDEETEFNEVGIDPQVYSHENGTDIIGEYENPDGGIVIHRIGLNGDLLDTISYLMADNYTSVWGSVKISHGYLVWGRTFDFAPSLDGFLLLFNFTSGELTRLNLSELDFSTMGIIHNINLDDVGNMYIQLYPSTVDGNPATLIKYKISNLQHQFTITWEDETYVSRYFSEITSNGIVYTGSYHLDKGYRRIMYRDYDGNELYSSTKEYTAPYSQANYITVGVYYNESTDEIVVYSYFQNPDIIGVYQIEKYSEATGETLSSQVFGNFGGSNSSLYRFYGMSHGSIATGTYPVNGSNYPTISYVNNANQIVFNAVLYIDDAIGLTKFESNFLNENLSELKFAVYSDTDDIHTLQIFTVDYIALSAYIESVLNPIDPSETQSDTSESDLESDGSSPSSFSVVSLLIMPISFLYILKNPKLKIREREVEQNH